MAAHFSRLVKDFFRLIEIFLLNLMALLTDTLIAENPCEKISEQHFLCAGRACGTVLGGVLDPCGEGKGGVPIGFGSIAKPYFLTALSKK